MVEAKRLLLYTGMTVAEVGYDLGFEDPAYFTRFFAEREGRAPSAFRAAARAQA
jgi:AraC family transcriptional activator of pobA